MASSSHVTNNQSWNLNETEVAYNLEKTATTRGLTEADEWQVFIPKLMPLMILGLPKEKTETLLSTLFVNEASCKPVVQKTIKSQNYIKVKRPNNRSFTYKYKTHNMELEVDVLHGNMDNIRISNNVDNSTPKVK